MLQSKTRKITKSRLSRVGINPFVDMTGLSTAQGDARPVISKYEIGHGKKLCSLQKDG
jgi:hypothetical protein